MPDLECGYSRDLFVEWASGPKNHIVLTCRTSPGTLARNFINNPTQDKVTLKVSESQSICLFVCQIVYFCYELKSVT